MRSAALIALPPRAPTGARRRALLASAPPWSRRRNRRRADAVAEERHKTESHRVFLVAMRRKENRAMSTKSTTHSYPGVLEELSTWLVGGGILTLALSQ